MPQQTNAFVVLVYELHNVSDAIRGDVHRFLARQPGFGFTGIHSTWEYRPRSPTETMDGAQSVVEAAFRTAARDHSIAKADFRLYGTSQALERIFSIP
jgi:hypothetical protein